MKSGCPSADPDLGVGEEFVGRQGEIQGRRSLPDAAGSVVDRAMARAEIAVVGSLVGDRDAAQMGADADQHLPLVVARLDPPRTRLLVRQPCPVAALGFLHLLLGPGL